jgi:predicted unusual protein kinase regulating ubiquinone biosynthesis (AarF/ABC1/UbiB family)
MSEDNNENSKGHKPARKNSAVPSSRIRRVSRLGALATQVAGNVVANGAGQWLKGERPALSSLLLTPKNITNIANQLASMRGAAMKLGQLISMDSGDFLPPELANILARLREDADPMPKSQLIDSLNEAWGAGWQDTLLYFSFAPVAAASIGQVHKAITLDGKILAIKVQYPGVKESIDSDIDNVARLIKLSGLVPSSVDVNTLLSHAKQQLHEEADYHREAAMLERYKQALDKDSCLAKPLFVVPEVYAPLTTTKVLAMDFVNAASLEVLQKEDQQTRDLAMTSLMTLFFKEVFDFRLLQSDPNLANYQFDTETKQWVLLDFGATREIPQVIAQAYHKLLVSAAYNDTTAMLHAALSIGLVKPEHSEAQQRAVVDLGMEACEAIRWQGAYDFGRTDLLIRLHKKGMALSAEHDFWHTPPADALFIHRKLGGLYLLAKRLEARIDMREAAKPWLAETNLI